MTKEQREDLFEEWSYYGSRQQNEMVKEYLVLCSGKLCKTGFLSFLKDKLEIEGTGKLLAWHDPDLSV